LNRTEKEQTVADLASGFSGATFVSLVAFKGLNVPQISSLRHELRAAGTEFRVVKNTLARRAIKGTDLEQLEEHFAGSTAVAMTTQDPTAPAKILAKFAKDHPKLEVRIGLLSGKPLSKENIASLSKLPSREVLLSMLLGTLKAPSSGLVYVLSGVLSKFVRTLAAIQQEKEKSASA
jgi:large subunit ribosomal protein L10